MLILVIQRKCTIVLNLFPKSLHIEYEMVLSKEASNIIVKFMLHLVVRWRKVKLKCFWVKVSKKKYVFMLNESCYKVFTIFRKSLNYRRKLLRLRSRIHRVVDYRGALWLWKPSSVQSRMFRWSIRPVDLSFTKK